MLIVILAAATMLVLAVFMAFVLGWANKTFHVEVDPRIEAVIEALPGANCGGCGLVGCSEYAEAVVAGKAAPDLCTVGGPACAAAVARILGVELEESFPNRPVVHCGARCADRLLGLGDCEVACEYDAIHMIDGLAVVDYDKCVGCGACQRACPRNIISMVPFKADRLLVVACSNKDFGKAVKAVCNVGCIGCKACTKVSELLTMSGDLASIDYDKYDADADQTLVAAAEKCPVKCLVFVGAAAEPAGKQPQEAGAAAGAAD